MPPIPIAITFHIPSSSSSRRIAHNSRVPSSTSSTKAYITYENVRNPKHTAKHQHHVGVNHPSTSSRPEINRHGADVAASTSSDSTTASSPPLMPTRSKRRKGPVYILPPAGVKTASLTPLLHPIISRCSAAATAINPSLLSEASSSILSPPRRRQNGQSKSARVTPSVMAPLIHPYSRATDLTNTRSLIPSPREILRARKAEEENARLKVESAAAARAAIAAKRKKTAGDKGKTRSASRAPGISARRKSDSPVGPVESRMASPETSHSAHLLDIANDDPITVTPSAAPTITDLGSRPTSLKRTRSHGVLPINTSVPGASAIVGIGSPLKEVMSRPEGEEDDGPRKRSRLGPDAGVDDVSPSRRATTHSPVGTPPSLVEDDERLSKTYPLPPGKVLPSRLAGRASSTAPQGAGEGAQAMRRVVSASGTGRAGSVGSDAGRERSRREIQLPERLRDYDVKAAVV
ncbi:hypothetical protein IAU60_006722 [Kwoniella sp. DSM 27419]